MDSAKTVVGQCPLCGGDVVKTLKGWACVNALEQEPKCSFSLFSVIGNRRLSDSEAERLLADRKILIDGFANKEGKRFSALVTFKQDGTTELSYTLGVCPKCGGVLYINERVISCGNFKATPPCNFSVWRNIGGHDLTLAEMEQLIFNGGTQHPLQLFDGKGNMTEQRLVLGQDKEVTRV